MKEILFEIKTGKDFGVMLFFKDKSKDWIAPIIKISIKKNENLEEIIIFNNGNYDYEYHLEKVQSIENYIIN